MTRKLNFLIASATLALVGGCNLRPDAGPPGTVYHQRNRAVIHDPFPGRFIGPEIEGARPLDYDRPLSQPTGNQTNPYANRGAFGF